MQQYQDSVTHTDGQGVAGASIRVLTAAGAQATIYSDNGVTVASNPIKAGANGQFAFYAADGNYSLVISAIGHVTRTLTGIVLDSSGSSANIPPAATLDGTEGANIKQGGGVVQTTLTKIAQWVIQTYQGFTQSGTGAVARTVMAKLLDAPVTPEDFGATGDGVTDDTAAIQAALNVGGRIRLKAKKYLVGSLQLAVHGTTFEGSGWGENGSVLLAKNSTGDVLKVPAGVHSCHITNIRFQANVARTSGYYVNFSDGWNRLDNFYMDGAFKGICFAASNNTAAHGYIWNTVASTGSCVDVLYGSGLVLEDIVTTNATNSQPMAAVNVTYCYDLIIDSCDFYGGGYDLYLHPSGGQYIGSVKAVNTFFDTAVRGVFVQPTTSGGIVRCTFDACWFGSHSQECVVLDATNGVIAGVHFNDPFVTSNGAGYDGFKTIGPVTDIQVNGGQFAGIAGAALSISSTTTHLKVKGAFFGAVGSYAQNGYNVYINGGASSYVFEGNSFGAAGSGNIVGHTPSATEIFRNNIGYVTESRGAATFPSGQTTFVVNHGLSATPAKEAIQLTAVSDVGTNRFWIGATSSTTFTISTNTAPAAAVYFGWRAAIVN